MRFILKRLIQSMFYAVMYFARLVFVMERQVIAGYLWSTLKPSVGVKKVSFAWYEVLRSGTVSCLSSRLSWCLFG